MHRFCWTLWATAIPSTRAEIPKTSKPSCCVSLPDPEIHGALQTLGVMQVRSGLCWGQWAVLPPVPVPTQAGTVPVSLALWLYCTAWKRTAWRAVWRLSLSVLSPHDIIGDMSPVCSWSPRCACCAQYTCRSSTKVDLSTHTGRCGASLGKCAGGEGQAQEL